MTNRAVSLIIPAYNAENSLRACIDSALSQTLKPYEVLVINDGSSDRTGEIARNYGDKIVYIEQENQGQGAARNKGLAQASGEFIAFLDADDYWLKYFLETCVSFLAQHSDTIAVSTGLIIKSASGEEKILPQCLHGPERMTVPVVLENFYCFWAEQDHIRTGSNVIRRSLIHEAGYQREDLRISQDLEYWGYIGTFGKWGFIPTPLWVGNSRIAFAATGLEKKYRKRRSLCPTVESWEKRIVKRLRKEQQPCFMVVRGRVAAGYAHNKILAGNDREAQYIIRKYVADMPHNCLTRLMKLGVALGPVGSWVMFGVILQKELVKSWSLYLRHKSSNG